MYTAFGLILHTSSAGFDCTYWLASDGLGSLSALVSLCAGASALPGSSSVGRGSFDNDWRSVH